VAPSISQLFSAIVTNTEIIILKNKSRTFFNSVEVMGDLFAEIMKAAVGSACYVF
jgi:hypothetical protein